MKTKTQQHICEEKTNCAFCRALTAIATLRVVANMDMGASPHEPFVEQINLMIQEKAKELRLFKREN